MSAYTFRPVTPADLPLLREWRSRPHWVEWWGPAEGDEGFFEEAMADPHTSAWIVELDGRAFAYAQDYDPHAWPGHPFAHLPPGARGIDQSIGDPFGFGPRPRQRLRPRPLRPPVRRRRPGHRHRSAPDNARAIRAYEKAGFAVSLGPLDTPWGRALLMERWR
jgi:aminoglycoside 6'-N-acetyltransferase